MWGATDTRRRLFGDTAPKLPFGESFIPLNQYFLFLDL
jgi:hypothetical protein